MQNDDLTLGRRGFLIGTAVTAGAALTGLTGHTAAQTQPQSMETKMRAETE